MDVTINDLDLMRYVDLQAACKEHKLPYMGKKADLIKRLTVKIAGKSDKYTGQLTKCKICGMPVSITSTNTTKLADGRMLIVRQVKCSGSHRHTYPLKEIV